jgi:hypothetical protein
MKATHSVPGLGEITFKTGGRTIAIDGIPVGSLETQRQQSAKPSGSRLTTKELDARLVRAHWKLGTTRSVAVDQERHQLALGAARWAAKQWNVSAPGLNWFSSRDVPDPTTRGFYHPLAPGLIWLRSNLKNASEIRVTVFHECSHHARAELRLPNQNENDVMDDTERLTSLWNQQQP